MTWQPIETAPRDGTICLVAEPSGFVHLAQWCADGYWRYRVTDPDLQWKPTHWMPLPPPPIHVEPHGGMADRGREY